MSTDLETYSKNARTVASESGSTAAIILEQDGDEWSLNAYDRDGSLGAYLVATDTVERARILALGRAIVDALDPAPDPPTPEPLAEWELGLLAGPQPTDDVCTCPPVEVEYVTAEPHLPLDVEIRTIALDAAVRVLEHTGGSLVEGAEKVERFLLGEEVVEQTAEEVEARFYTEERAGVWGIRDRERPDRFAPFGRNQYAVANDRAAGLNGQPASWPLWDWDKITS